MTVSSERERVKEKIVKLLNVTRERGASENEAMMAAERAAELMTHFDIGASELSIRSARSAEKIAKKRRYGRRHIATSCAHLVAQLCDCMTWHHPDRHVFFGRPRDAEIAAQRPRKSRPVVAGFVDVAGHAVRDLVQQDGR